MTFAAADSYVQVQLNTAMPSLGVTGNANNTLTIQEAGDYEIAYNLLMSGNAAATMAAAVRNNGSVLQQSRGAQTLSVDGTAALSHDARLSASTVASLPAGSTLDLALSVVNTLPAGFTVLLNGYANATLTVKKLSR